MTLQREYSRTYQQPSAAERYESAIYRPGGHDEVIWRCERVLLEELIRKHRRCPSRDDAMDFACGTGRVTSFLHGRRGDLVGSLVGVDISPAMLARARPKVGDTELICADIVNHSEDVPGEKDIITCFRFLLLAEPALREAVVRQLVTKLRDESSILIFSLHGNPRSYRGLAAMRNRLTGRPPLPRFGLGEMETLAGQVGLELIDVAGTGYLPHSVARRMPERLFDGMERLLMNRPLLRKFGSNLLVVCRKK